MDQSLLPGKTKIIVCKTGCLSITINTVERIPGGITWASERLSFVPLFPQTTSNVTLSISAL